MKIIIHTLRRIQTWPSFQIVYEWENVIKSELKEAKLSYVSNLYKKIIRITSILKLRGYRLSKNKIIFHFDMGAKTRSDLYNRPNVIPLIIDFFLDKKNIPNFEQAYQHNQLTLISSKEVYEWLKLNKCKINIAHLALSLPDKYKITNNEIYTKKYDFVLVGRQNPILKNFLDLYIKTHPNIIYVYENKEKFHYYTNRGEYVGYYKSRDGYIQLTRMSRIALYSTPAMDDSRKNTNGFNQVTPKFLEYIACECHLILRYPDNPDTKYYELNSFCPCIETYEQFENKVNEYLSCQPNINFYSQYLLKHYTSARVKEMKLLLNQIYGKEF